MTWRFDNDAGSSDQAALSKMLGGVVSRRRFVGGLAVMAGSSAALLAACAEDDDDADAPAAVTDDDPEDDPDDQPADDDDEVADDTDDEPDDDVDDDTEDAQRGGTLHVALQGDPPTMDLHRTTTVPVADIGWHIYEPLFTYDEDFELVLDLADSFEISDDGVSVTVGLRDGVTFHNGDSLSAEDVIASIERWVDISGQGAVLADVLTGMNELDDLTVEFELNEPLGVFQSTLARQLGGCAIYPASVVAESAPDELADVVGTGPYQFVEYSPDVHTLLERFDDFTPRDEPPSGYGGGKNQHLDEIEFLPVPDEASRVAGLQAGDYHYADNLIPDHFETLDGQEGVVAEIVSPTNVMSFVLNTREGVLADQTMRQAFQAALDHEPILHAAFGGDFYRLDPSVMLEETAWHSTAGEEYYNRNDPERAQELLEEAGYDGEPIIWMTTQEYAYHYDASAVAIQQLEDAGFNIDLQVYDWATVIDRRDNPENWHVLPSGQPAHTDPAFLLFIPTTEWPGWWDSDGKVELVNQLQRETDFDTRFEIWEQIQELYYEEVPLINVGGWLRIIAYSAAMRDYEPVILIGSTFWNTWLEE